jgi:hypothetical protein
MQWYSQFAPNACFGSMVAIRNMHWEQIDYTTAYLNALIDERYIFMRPLTKMYLSSISALRYAVV